MVNKEKQAQHFLEKYLVNVVFYFWQLVTFVWATLFPAGSLGRCRFSPTCSDYARQAIKQYGMILGVWLSIKRLLRCHPGNLGGYDPVK